MARYTGPSCRLCRREGEKLFLKGKRCFTEKCAIERRAYPPGEHGTGRRRRRQSEYAVQLREKQKVKRIYGLAERQFHSLFRRAARIPGVTGENLLVALESRLDNIVYRLGFAPSRKAARQLIRHRHVRVDGQTVDVPSYAVSPGQEIAMTPAAAQMPVVKEAVEDRRNRDQLSWLGVDYENLTGRMLERPARADIPLAVQEQLIVELYSK
ncbi:MAG: 30S ribosomal protein S4 [Gemmatimonadota bacterium]|jgi:small subunit ribosomal protein S4|nr:MAG: 30S ribosomal protein S4 [Gemmatimonadota bacterium]